MKKKIYIFLLLAGNGSRFQRSLSLKRKLEKKQFLKINNIPIYIYSLLSFLELKKKLLQYQFFFFLIAQKRDFIRIKKNLKEIPFSINKNEIFYIEGGKERYNSIMNGLNRLKEISNRSSSDFIIIHDAVRPLITTKNLYILIKRLEKYPCVSYFYPMQDSLKMLEDPKRKTFYSKDIKSIDRNKVIGIQTPQGFHAGILEQAYSKLDSWINITEDTEPVLELGVPVHLIKGEKMNWKITEMSDFLILKKVIEANINGSYSLSFKKDLKK